MAFAAGGKVAAHPDRQRLTIAKLQYLTRIMIANIIRIDEFELI